MSATGNAKERALKERAAEAVGHGALALGTGVALHSAHSMGYRTEATVCAAALFVGGTMAKIAKPDEAYADMLQTVGNAAGAAQVARVVSDGLLDWTGARPQSQMQDSYAAGFDEEMTAFGQPQHQEQQQPQVQQVNGGLHAGTSIQ